VLEGKYDGPAFAKASAGLPTVASAKVETEGIMQAIARILTANSVELQPAEPAEAIPSIACGNEPKPECRLCMDSGWRRVKIRVLLDAREKTVNVDPDNLPSCRNQE